MELKPNRCESIQYTFDYYIVNKYCTKKYIYPVTNKKLFLIREYYENPVFQEVTWNYIRNANDLNLINEIVEIEPNMNYHYMCNKILNFCKHRLLTLVESNECNNEVIKYANELPENFIFNNIINFDKIICYNVKERNFINLS